MNLEALKQTLESLDINPDEIEDEIYAKVFRILFAIIEILSEEIDALKSENQKLRDEINVSSSNSMVNFPGKNISIIFII